VQSDGEACRERLAAVRTVAQNGHVLDVRQPPRDVRYSTDTGTVIFACLKQTR
jgi:hypothetical protein